MIAAGLAQPLLGGSVLVLTAAAAARGTWSPCGLSMVSAINPFSEVSRGHRYVVTVLWFVAGAVVGGALLGLGQLLHEEPERNDAEAADTVTEHVLTLLGMDADEAHRICQLPLPDIASLGHAGSAA